MVQKCIIYKKTFGKCQRNLFSVKLEVLIWCHKHFQTPVFGLAVMYPTGSEISPFWYIKTRGRKSTIKYTFLLYLSVHCGEFIEQIKKICHIHVHFNYCIRPVTPTQTTLDNYTYHLLILGALILASTCCCQLWNY